MLCNESHFLPEGVEPATDHSDNYSRVSITGTRID
jgi:hypothetical protein